MITSVHNPLVKYLVKLREDRPFRVEQKSVIVAGFKLVREIATYLPPKRVFVEHLEDAPKSGETHQVTPHVLKKITGLVSPEPIAAEFSLPQPSDVGRKAPILVLDAIRDPGNLGTLLRTALALGWGGVFFLPTCVDFFGEKAIRASRGALFRLPWREGSWEELQKLLQQEKMTLYIADLEGESLERVDFNQKSALLLSNEAQGIAAHTLGLGRKITIPMKGEMESLNVAIAGAILMYTLHAK